MRGKVLFVITAAALMAAVALTLPNAGHVLGAGLHRNLAVATAVTMTPAATSTATATAVPTSTATAVPTATSAPLGAVPQIISRVSLHRVGSRAVVSWKMHYQLGVKGFRIFAGHKQLKSVRPHHRLSYAAKVKWMPHRHYSLLVLVKHGHSRRFAAH